MRAQTVPTRKTTTETIRLPIPTTSTAKSTTTQETSTERKPDEEVDQTTQQDVGDTVMPTQETIKSRARLLNLNVDELQNFAIALHNDTDSKSNKKHMSDLSDVNLDVDDEDEPRMIPEHKHKDIPEKFYHNLQAPFHPLMAVDRAGSEEIECKENEINYKVSKIFELLMNKLRH